MTYKIKWLIALMLPVSIATAQVKKPAPKKTVETVQGKAKLVAVGSVVKKGIAIRWAPDNEYAWRQLNRAGYIIERYTVMRDGKMLNKVEKRTVKYMLRPLPLKLWDTTFLNKDDYAAVIAQALYGESFDMIMQDKQNVQALVSLSKQQKQRYAMAMYAADRSFKAARMAGLGWYDTAVAKNEKYLYRIFSPVAAGVLRLDTAKVFIGLSDDKALPKPAEIFPQPGDKSAMLAWEFDNLSDYYGSYYIERSDDGGATYQRIGDRPVTKLTMSTEGAPNGSVVYSDTLSNNTVEYRYRIAGLTIFDEVGPYSDVVTVKGIPKIETAPHITGVVNVGEGKGTLQWEIEDSVVHLVKNFEIHTADVAEGPYRVLRSNIDVRNRSVALDSISSDAAYITVIAVVKEGENKTSMPYLLQAEDSVAPAIPMGLKGSIDSNGIVKLSWNPNAEKDLIGYKLFKTYVQGQELNTIMDTVWLTNNFTDTVELKNLNSKVYYSVRAVDKRYNQSDFAPVLEVKKPDVIPPSQAVFKDYQLIDTAVTINWINSYDKDVAVTKLMRKMLADSSNWQLVKEFTTKATTYTDHPDKGGSTYAYTLISTDSSGLASSPALPLTIFIPMSFDKNAVKNLTVEVDRDNRRVNLNWELPGSGTVAQIELYRSSGKDKISLYKVFDERILSYTDLDLKVNTKYQYGVRVVFNDGKFSDLKIKKANY